MKTGTLTSNGIMFKWCLTTQQGAHYDLFPSKQHTEKDIYIAKLYMWDNFDPVTLRVIK